MSKALKTLIAVFSGLSIVVALTLLFLFNPARCGFYPECEFYKMTGLLCPGCGGLRATYELLHGRLELAFRYNPLFISALPFLGAWFVRGLVKEFKHEPAAFDVPPFCLWLIIAVVVLFGVLRNLPISPFPPLPS